MPPSPTRAAALGPAAVEAAVNACMHPLYEIEHGITTVTVDPEKAGKKVDKAIEKAGEQIEKAGEKISGAWPYGTCLAATKNTLLTSGREASLAQGTKG